ncbi:MAG TPA: hypothetical protein VIV06_11265, partial [Candidatus Limnocylindrales bacterium]
RLLDGTTPCHELLVGGEELGVEERLGMPLTSPPCPADRAGVALATMTESRRSRPLGSGGREGRPPSTRWTLIPESPGGAPIERSIAATTSSRSLDIVRATALALGGSRPGTPWARPVIPVPRPFHRSLGTLSVLVGRSVPEPRRRSA